MPCPVCGFVLSFEPWTGESASLEICPCCGIHFGYDDYARGSAEARARIYRDWRGGWVQQGMPWWSKTTEPPAGWNPREQVKSVKQR